MVVNGLCITPLVILFLSLSCPVLPSPRRSASRPLSRFEQLVKNFGNTIQRTPFLTDRIVSAPTTAVLPEVSKVARAQSNPPVGSQVESKRVRLRGAIPMGLVGKGSSSTKVGIQYIAVSYLN